METYSIQINSDNHALSVTLLDILNHITKGNQLSWAILWIYAVGDLGDNLNMLDFETEVNESKDGYAIDWDKLKTLASKFEQIIELILIGDKDVRNLRRYSSNAEMNNSCSYAIELVDSSFWIINSKQKFDLVSMRKSFPNVEVLNL